MSYIEENNSETVDVRMLIPHKQPDGSFLYKQNPLYKGNVFPLDIKKHNILMDVDDSWKCQDGGLKYFNFDPNTKRGKALISKYSQYDEDGSAYVISALGQKVYGKEEIATEVLNLMHLDYMYQDWVRIQT